MRVPEDEDINFIGTKELAELMGCSIVQARQIMHREDFPMIRIGKEMKVMKCKLIEWASMRRE